MQLIKKFCGFSFQKTVGSPISALGQNNFRTVSPFCNKLRDDFDRILQINIYGNDGSASGMRKPGKQSRLLAEVAGKGERLYQRVCFR